MKLHKYGRWEMLLLQTPACQPQAQRQLLGACILQASTQEMAIQFSDEMPCRMDVSCVLQAACTKIMKSKPAAMLWWR